MFDTFSTEQIIETDDDYIPLVSSNQFRKTQIVRKESWDQDTKMFQV
jgi:hypothetical protein